MYPQGCFEVVWHLTNRCNFDCYYCHPQIKRDLNRKHLDERPAEEYVEAFGRLSEVCHILMTGGEPFLFPRFMDLCSGLTAKHFISLNTNLSSPLVEDFFERIEPSRVVSILAAIHVQERERLNFAIEVFAEKYLVGMRRGFAMSAAYVLHPTTLYRAAQDIAKLRELGVTNIEGKLFKGVYERKRYPDSYNEQEREIVQSLAGSYTLTPMYLAGELNKYGLLCNAGVRSVRVDVQGNILRCDTVREPLGNIFDEGIQLHSESYPCTARRVLVLSQCNRLLEK
jgi:MoaA/NifB/PqqE/SkfB family radical SAM enzyme